MLLWSLISLSIGCKDGPDTGLGCEPTGEPSLVVGSGLGGDFYPFEAGQTVGLTSAPQGGFGVGVRAKVSGLVVDEGDGNAPLPVLLETDLDGTLSDSFTNTGATAYCQDDGTGLVWDLVVGFDREKYSSADDLIGLQGANATLRIEATDLEGNVASGEVDVVIEVD